MNRKMERATGVLLAVALATALLVPAAEAGRRGPHRRALRHGPVFVERHSDAGVVFGFLGGLVLGTVIANAQAPAGGRAYGRGYAYYDPYCRETFASLEGYEVHLVRHRHPCTAEVVDVRGGRCLDTVHRRDGRWTGGDAWALDDGGRDDAPPYEEWED